MIWLIKILVTIQYYSCYTQDDLYKNMCHKNPFFTDESFACYPTYDNDGSSVYMLIEHHLEIKLHKLLTIMKHIYILTVL